MSVCSSFLIACTIHQCSVEIIFGVNIHCFPSKHYKIDTIGMTMLRSFSRIRHPPRSCSMKKAGHPNIRYQFHHIIFPSAQIECVHVYESVSLINNNNNIQHLYSALLCFTLKRCCECYKIDSDFINLGFINETCLQHTTAHMY